MVRKKSNKTLFIVLSIIGALVLIAGVIFAVKAMSPNEVAETNDTATKDEPAVNEQPESTEAPIEEQLPEEEEVKIDSELLNTVDIEPMAIVVSYMKGISGFEYQVERTPSGTQYVQFSSTKLAGTKCTNDIGQFASIIESPSADETSTLAKTTTVDGTTYGLSLADATCTSNDELLNDYQESFTKPFSLLKKM